MRMHNGLRFLDLRGHLSGGRLLVVSALVTAAVFGTRPLISYRALALNASVVELGLIASSFAIFALVASIPVGRAVDRFGQQRAIVLGSLVVAIGCLLAWASPSVLSLALSQSVGPLVAGVLLDRGAGDLFLALGALGALLGAGVGTTLGLIRPAARGAQETAGGPLIRRMLGKPTMRSALVASIALLAAVDLMIAYLPLIGEERGIPPATIGLLLGTLGLAQMVARLFIGPLLAVLGHARTLIIAGAVPAVAIPLIAFVSPPLVPAALTVVLVAVIGLFLGLGQPVTVTLAAVSAEPGASGVAMSMRMAANRLGQTVIPVAAAGAAGRAGATGIFVTIGVFLAATIGYVGWEIRRADPGS